MSGSRPPAHDVSTEKAIKHLSPKEAGEAARLEATGERKPAGGAERTAKVEAEQRDRGAKDFALRRLRESPGGELAVFGDRLRRNTLRAGATEQELPVAQSGHREHG